MTIRRRNRLLNQVAGPAPKRCVAHHDPDLSHLALDEIHGQHGARAVYEPSEGRVVSTFAPNHRNSFLNVADFDHCADL